MEDPMVKVPHADVALRYRLHGARIEHFWRSFSQSQKIEALDGYDAVGYVITDAMDEDSINYVRSFAPEWNARDLASSSSNFFLDVLKFRATTSLLEQYAKGVNGEAGDRERTNDAMKIDAEYYASSSDFPLLKFNEEQYGTLCDVTQRDRRRYKSGRLDYLVSEEVGEKIVLRQSWILQSLKSIMENILNISSSVQEVPLQKPLEAATVALAKLSFDAPTKKLDVSDILDIALEQKYTWKDYVELLSSDPTFLGCKVSFRFLSRPEFKIDENGDDLGWYSDMYTSRTFFEAVHETVKTAALWSYIASCLEMLKASTDKKVRAILCQELFNACHLEYRRAQEAFKRGVSTGLLGKTWFKRDSNVGKDGIIRISVAGKIAKLRAREPQLYYMLRLCKSDTDPSDSLVSLEKLEALYRNHPQEKEKLMQPEYEAMGDLATISTFIQSLTVITPSGSIRTKKNKNFAYEYEALDKELRQLNDKDELDLNDFAVPICWLLEPGMATGALEKINEYFVEKTGTKLGFLYEDLLEGCVAKLREQFERVNAKVSEAIPSSTVPIAEESPELRIEERKKKEKTRPDPSMYEIVPEVAAAAAIDAVPPTQPSDQTRNKRPLKPSTSAVFSTLFTRSSEARGSISWNAFVAAMADLKFTITPKVGSIYTFVPPPDQSIQRNVTLHRPHHAQINPHYLLIYSKRLNRAYGWDEMTFAQS